MIAPVSLCCNFCYITAFTGFIKGQIMLDSALLGLTHEQQQQAVEKIQQLMEQGIPAGQAIAMVAEELRQNHQQNEQKSP